MHFVGNFTVFPGETVISYSSKDYFYYICINTNDLEPNFVIKIAMKL